MALFIVNTNADENDAGASVVSPGGTGLSLREALVLANGNPDQDTITFASGSGEAFEGGGTIFRAAGLGQLEISSDVTIDGDLDNDGAPDLMVDANSADGLDDAAGRVFFVSSGTSTIDGLTITGGNVLGAGRGGGILTLAGSDVTVTSSLIDGNRADAGGGIENGGILTLSNSTVSNNYTSGDGGGGGIDAGAGTTTRVTDSSFTGNISANGDTSGGGIFAFDGASLYVYRSSALGIFDIVGTNSADTVRLLAGSFNLDASFNDSGDTITFDETANDFFASQSGSSVLLEGSDTDALISVSPTATTLAFGDGSDTREIILDNTIPAIFIGSQEIGMDPVQLMAA